MFPSHDLSAYNERRSRVPVSREVKSIQAGERHYPQAKINLGDLDHLLQVVKGVTYQGEQLSNSLQAIIDSQDDNTIAQAAPLYIHFAMLRLCMLPDQDFDLRDYDRIINRNDGQISLMKEVGEFRTVLDRCRTSASDDVLYDYLNGLDWVAILKQAGTLRSIPVKYAMGSDSVFVNTQLDYSEFNQDTVTRFSSQLSNKVMDCILVVSSYTDMFSSDFASETMSPHARLRIHNFLKSNRVRSVDLSRALHDVIKDLFKQKDGEFILSLRSEGVEMSAIQSVSGIGGEATCEFKITFEFECDDRSHRVGFVYSVDNLKLDVSERGFVLRSLKKDTRIDSQWPSEYEVSSGTKCVVKTMLYEEGREPRLSSPAPGLSTVLGQWLDFTTSMTTDPKDASDMYQDSFAFTAWLRQMNMVSGYKDYVPPYYLPLVSRNTGLLAIPWVGEKPQRRSFCDKYQLKSALLMRMSEEAYKANNTSAVSRVYFAALEQSTPVSYYSGVTVETIAELSEDMHAPGGKVKVRAMDESITKWYVDAYLMLWEKSSQVESAIGELRRLGAEITSTRDFLLDIYKTFYVGVQSKRSYDISVLTNESWIPSVMMWNVFCLTSKLELAADEPEVSPFRVFGGERTLIHLTKRTIAHMQLPTSINLSGENRYRLYYATPQQVYKIMFDYNRWKERERGDKAFEGKFIGMFSDLQPCILSKKGTEYGLSNVRDTLFYKNYNVLSVLSARANGAILDQTMKPLPALNAQTPVTVGEVKSSRVCVYSLNQSPNRISSLYDSVLRVTPTGEFAMAHESIISNAINLIHDLKCGS